MKSGKQTIFIVSLNFFWLKIFLLEISMIYRNSLIFSIRKKFVLEKPNNLDPTNLSTGNELLLDIYYHFDTFKYDKEPFNSITTLMSFETFQDPNSYSWRYRHIRSQNQLVVGQPSVVTLDKFLEKWNNLSNGMFNNFNWNNVVVAGGAVLGCLLPGNQKV